MQFNRSSGVLLHPTSLPSPYGIGELGPQAYAWVDWLAGTGCALWQVLPLGPTSYGDSPYQCFSAFAGNPYLISFDQLVEDQLLVAQDFADRPAFKPDWVDFGVLYIWKLALLDKAYQRFVSEASENLKQAFAEFKQREASWLDDFTLFMAIKDAHQGQPWWEWADNLKLRKATALNQAKTNYAAAIEKHAFRQFLFFTQWDALKAYANAQGIQIVGDIPIFVAYDSSDVWANPELFYLDQDANLTVQAGVPPDYFSATGQLWGNPLYRWDVHRASDYAWWFDRLRSVLQLFDFVRLDHFRAFYDYWEIPAGAETAEKGQWVAGPGADFFQKLEVALGDLPIIAEDLGDLNPKVYDLRDQFNLPGMKVLVFAFGEDEQNMFLPHHYSAHSVVYTGTHDNDTAQGWYARVPEKERDFARRYLSSDGKEIAWDLIQLAWHSLSAFAMAPLQDFLSLGNEARMNVPGTLGTFNWSWRLTSGQLTPELQARIRELNESAGRRK